MSDEKAVTSNQCDNWILWFSDIDREQVHFSGHGAEAAARKAFEHSKVAWTCRLYRCVDHSGYGPVSACDHETPSQADARDAARYRQLRKGNDYCRLGPMVVLCEQDHIDSDDRPFWVLSDAGVDEAVDEALGAVNGEVKET